MNADKLADAKHRIRNLLTLVAVDGSACGAAQHEIEEIFAALAERGAQAAQTAQPVGVPDGWVMVPIEPTCLMQDATCIVYNEHDEDVGVDYSESNFIYKAMLEAAPQPPAQLSADAVSIAAEISTRPEFAKYEAPLILDIVRETLKAARAAEGGKS